MLIPLIFMSCALPLLEGWTSTAIIRLIAGPAAAYKVVLGVMMTELLQHCQCQGRQGRMFAVCSVRWGADNNTDQAMSYHDSMLSKQISRGQHWCQCILTHILLHHLLIFLTLELSHRSDYCSESDIKHQKHLRCTTIPMYYLCKLRYCASEKRLRVHHICSS